MRRLGVVVIVLAGLMLIGSAFGVIATSSVSLAGIQDSGTDAWTVVVPFLLGITAVVGFGVWLVGSREALASRLFDDSEIGFSIGPLELLRVGIIVIGLMLVIESIPRVIGAISEWMTYSTLPSYGFDVQDYPIRWWDAAGDTLIAVVQLVVGVVFARGSGRIASRLWEARPQVDASAPKANCPACGAEYDPADYRDIDAAICEECHEPIGSGSA